MEEYRRTVTCGELTVADEGKTVTLNGWVHRIRDHGGIYFLNIRDRYGITQTIVDKDVSDKVKKTLSELKMEYCVAVTGTVRARLAGMENTEMDTGTIEVSVNHIEILNSCEVLPFMIDSEEAPGENLRLKCRSLDLRTTDMRNRLRMRHEAVWSIRTFLTEEGFWDVETPTLIKSTPEGARDYLVPSRVNEGRFYALPQSPQLYKQILMAGGVDRYYQVARCYRDEDARGDRQPEFTQIDLEMSFVSRDDVLELVEKMMIRLFREVLDVNLPSPFPRMSWKEAMDTYGSDKPDLRFGMEFQDFSSFVPNSEFGVFKDVLKMGGAVKALVVKGAAELYSRKKISELEQTACSRGAKGLAWMKVTPEGLDGGVSKFYIAQAERITEELDAEPGDLILLCGANWKTAVESLGAVRLRLGKELNLLRKGEFKPCWLIEFPLFEKNEESGGWEAAHHMFSMPQTRFLDSMEENPGEVIGDLYDLVLNGNEVASGSVRIHNPDIQNRIFKIVGFPEQEANKRFGFLLDALRHGAPPHAGLAAGLDRLLMLMSEVDTIRDVIAFPKNTQGISPMDGSPSDVDMEQLAELHLQVVKNNNVAEK